ncbi:MAG: hypothetical protein FJ363_10925 [Gemmatimonadetes bacterium]|nr:hypothetical protein [Gemmatimonadota bacterium]
MTGSGYPGFFRLVWELATGRRTVERSGPLLDAFINLPAPVRDAIRWLLRPKRRFLLWRLRALSGDRVMSGPFAGMQLAGLPAAPELLGTYEREIGDAVRALAAQPFRRVVNVGARFGYYAIGLARLMPRAEILAFEGSDEARVVLETAVALNGVGERVHVGGFCDVSDLAAALADGTDTLVACDIDGGEVPLLDPSLVPALRRATLLVECHGPAETPTEAVMTMRFLPTHDLRRIGVEGRALADLPAGVGGAWRRRMPGALEALMQEHRTMPQSWLLLTPRADGR